MFSGQKTYEECKEKRTISKFKSSIPDRAVALENKLLNILCRELSNEHSEYIIS